MSALHRTYVRRHLRAESALRYAGETCTCPPCTAHACEERFALCRRDTHVSTLHCTCVRRALRAMQARHARVRLAQHIRAESASRYHDAGETRMCPPCTAHTCEERFALCRQDTHVSASLCTYVRRELRAIMMQARHARARPAPHIRANSASHYAGGHSRVRPAPHLRAESALRHAGETRTHLSQSTPM